MALALFLISLVGGLFSGLLGIGGAVVLIPLMRAVPPPLGAGELTMGEIAGITMIQVLAASITGWLTHRRGGRAHTPTILAMGIPLACAAFAGAYWRPPEIHRHIVFGILVTLALGMLFGKSREERADPRDGDSADFAPNIPLAILLGGLVGLSSGIVGAGGGFILIPLMIRVLKVPIKIAVGSSLGIIFLGALMGVAGKIASTQVEWKYVLPVLLASVPASIVGAKLSAKVKPTYIRRALFTMVLLAFAHTWWDLLQHSSDTADAAGKQTKKINTPAATEEMERVPGK